MRFCLLDQDSEVEATQTAPAPTAETQIHAETQLGNFRPSRLERVCELHHL